jgi:DNA gyrase inhibitor GyrI
VLVKMMAAFCVLMLAGVVVVVAGCKATRGGYESAPYKVVRRDRKFELRDYPSLTVVETPMSGRGSNGADGSFNRLFRFITGNNEANQKIAMTTPVFMSSNETNRAMAFVMPSGEKVEQLPKPKDANVTIREVAAGRYAVLRYSGGRSTEKEADAERRLKSWMEAQRLPAKPPPVFGYFDPPWTPAFLRRNEVMLLTDFAGP